MVGEREEHFVASVGLVNENGDAGVALLDGDAEVGGRLRGQQARELVKVVIGDDEGGGDLGLEEHVAALADLETGTGLEGAVVSDLGTLMLEVAEGAEGGAGAAGGDGVRTGRERVVVGAGGMGMSEVLTITDALLDAALGAR